MDPQRMKRLEARAFPEGGVLGWRRTRRTLLAVAAVLAIAGQPFPAVIVLALAVPVTVRYVRRELALGALIAEGHREQRELARLPVDDLRSIHRSLL